MKNRYLLPESTREVSTLRIGVKGAGRIVNKDAHKFWIEAALNGALPLETKMNLSEENVFTENVLNPDLRFSRPKRWKRKLIFSILSYAIEENSLDRIYKKRMLEMFLPINSGLALAGNICRNLNTLGTEGAC